MPASHPRLSRRLVLERPRRVTDAGGGADIVWEPIGTLWADLRAGSAREDTDAVRETVRVTHRVTIRTAPPGSARYPRPDQRFRSGARVFNILGVAEAAQAAYLTCWVEEGPFA